MKIKDVLNDIATSKVAWTTAAGFIANNSADTSQAAVELLSDMDNVDTTMGIALVVRVLLAVWRNITS